MKLSEINSLLNLTITLLQFRSEVASEIELYKKDIQKKGASTPIYLNEDLDNLEITKDHVRFLCNAFLSKQLDEWELNYIAEGLLLSDRITFDSEATYDSLSSLTDAEFFVLVGNQYVRKVLTDLGD